MLKVQFGALEEAAASISRQAGAVEARLARLDHDLAPLRSDWTGAASEAYQRARSEWTLALEEMHVLLAQLGVAVRTSADAYLAGEQQNAARW